MKHLFLAATILVGPALSPAAAEYLMIKIDLNKLPPPIEPNQAGQPPGVMPRAPGGPGGPGGMRTPGTTESDEPPLWASAYLQLKQKTGQVAVGNIVLTTIEHQWGKAFIPQSLPNVGTLKFYHQASVAQRFVERKKFLEKEGKSPEKLLLLAEWALEHGLTQPFLLTMDELGKADAKHPAVLAVNKVREAMARPVSGFEPMALTVTEELKEENYRTVTSDAGHYVLFTDLRAEKQNEIDLKKWVERLEDNYRGFFYWFAVKGKVLPVPSYRLVAVVVAGKNDFLRKHESFNPGPTVAPGFLVRRPNVAVFCAVPLDPAYEKLEQHNRKEWEAVKVGRDDLLSGEVVKKRADLAANPMYGGPMLIAKLQTLAVLQKAMEKESGRAAVTHEGTRQLLAATGLLPRGVVAAEWVHFGMSSFFETPFQAFYVGVGLPNWIYLVEFKHLKKTGELGRSTEVLLKTIGDRYFIAANATQQQLETNKDERELLEPVLDRELMTARTSAWALTYYLAKHKLDNLEKYFQELASLPRDLAFDEAVLQGCFARAFGLGDATDAGKLDTAKVTRLAEAWYSSMEGESLDLLEVQTDALRERGKTDKRAAAHPSGSGVPPVGGNPGAGAAAPNLPPSNLPPRKQ